MNVIRAGGSSGTADTILAGESRNMIRGKLNVGKQLGAMLAKLMPTACQVILIVVPASAKLYYTGLTILRNSDSLNNARAIISKIGVVIGERNRDQKTNQILR